VTTDWTKESTRVAGMSVSVFSDPWSALVDEDDVRVESTESFEDGGLRAWRWRLQLGLLASRDNRRAGSSFFTADEDYLKVLDEQVAGYKKDKTTYMPSVANFSADPLMGGQEQLKMHYEDLELIKFIGGDLDRLYVDGVADDYFQEATRKDMVLNVLFVWSVQHKDCGAYRQGMHELVAFIVFAVECEVAYMRELQAGGAGGADGDEKCGDSAISAVVRAKLMQSGSDQDTLEAYVFAVFDRLMVQGEVNKLYDPAYADFIVGFCASVQGAKLRDIDTVLVEALEAHEIDANLYGMRWVRLLFGREFAFQQTLVLWDHLFSTFSAKSKVATSFLDELGNVMVAMLLRLRGVLIRGDMSECLSVLMRYPPLTDSDFMQTILVVTRQLRDKSFTFVAPADDGYDTGFGVWDDAAPPPPSSSLSSTADDAPDTGLFFAAGNRMERFQRLAANLPKMPQLPQMPKIERPKWLSNSPWRGSDGAVTTTVTTADSASGTAQVDVTDRLDALAQEVALGCGAAPRALELRLRCLASILAGSSSVQEYDTL